MRVVVRSLVVATTALLSGCGQSGTSASTAESQSTTKNEPSVRACDLLSQSDAEQVLSHPVEKLNATGGAAGLDICQYGYEGERIIESGNVSVILHEQPLEAMRTGVTQSGYRAEPVAGMNDAFWSDESGLYVSKGGRTAIINLGAGGMTDAKARAVALGAKIQARM